MIAKKRLMPIFVTVLMVLFIACSFSPKTLAAEITTEQVVNYQNLANGVAVMDNGIIYAVSGSSIKGFNSAGTTVFSASLPAKCGNLCAYGEHLFAAGYMNGHMNELYVLKPGIELKTLYAGQRVQAVAVDYDGYLYCVNSTGTRSNGKKATKILKAKISDVVSLSSGQTISWTQEYQPDYAPPSSDGNCYPQGIAVDGKGVIYIADKGSSNGYDASVNGVYRYDPSTGRIDSLHFTSGSTQRLFTWIYDICADDFGTVAVVGRNNYEIAVFRPGSTSADKIIKANGFPEGAGIDREGNVYFNASNNSDSGKNGIYRINMGHIAVTGIGLSTGSMSIDVGKSSTLTADVTPSDATNKQVLYSSSNISVATVDASGKITGKSAGSATITVRTVQGRKTASCSVTVNNPASGGSSGSDNQPTSGNTPGTGNQSTSGNTSGSDNQSGNKSNSGTVSKAANPMTIKGKTATVKYSKLKKKTQYLAVTKVIKFTKKLNDKKTYTLTSAKKGKKSFKKYFKINKNTGKVTVKKGLKKGTYKVKIKVKALGNNNYKESAAKTVTFTVKVK